jgi:hypothetical protein
MKQYEKVNNYFSFSQSEIYTSISIIYSNIAYISLNVKLLHFSFEIKILIK